MLWQKYFKLVKLVPGKVIVPVHGTIDFSKDVPVETCRQLWEDDFEFLQITDEGKRELYGIESSEFKVQSSKLKEPETVNPEPGTEKEQPAKPRRRSKKREV